MTEETESKTLEELRSVLANIEQVLQGGTPQDSEATRALRTRIDDALRSARARLADMERSARARTTAAARAADDFVHEKPWQSIALGAAAGVVLGMLIARR